MLVTIPGVVVDGEPVAADTGFSRTIAARNAETRAMAVMLVARIIVWDFILAPMLQYAGLSIS